MHYHICNRGVERRKIFMDERDYLFFLRRMGDYKRKQNISLLCYSLMPNHFHIFVRQNDDNKTPGKFISDLANSYTRAFNKRHNRTGVLLQGPSRIIPVKSESHYIWLCKYILMNPVKAKLAKQPMEWPYSSATEYFNNHSEGLTDTGEILACFKDRKDFKSFIQDTNDHFDYGVFEP